MSDVEVLFFVLALVYGWECACWLPAGTIGFRTWLGRKWRTVIPSGTLSNQHGGFIFAPPIPPFGTTLQCSLELLSISPEGLLTGPPVQPVGWPKTAQPRAWFAFSSDKRFEPKHKRLVFDGRSVFRAASVSQAVQLARDLNEINQLPTAQRPEAIRQLASKRFDVGAIKGKLAEFHHQTRSLRVAANCLFLFVFAASPVLIWQLGFALAWPGLLGGLLLLAGAVTWFFAKAHRTLKPDHEDERFTQSIMVALSPASAMRAVDLLSRALAEQFHPLAMTAALGNAAGTIDLASRMLRDLAYPLDSISDERACRTQAYARELAKDTLVRFLEEHKIDPQPLLRAPQKADPSCESYCPRCLAQFTVHSGACVDCGNRELVRFNAATLAAPARP